MSDEATDVAAGGEATSRQRLAIFVILATCFTLCQFMRAALAVIVPEIAVEASLSADELGIIASTFFLAVAATQIPAGILFDRFGVRLTTSLTLIVAVIGGFVFAWGYTFLPLALGQLLLGLGTSSVFMGSVVVIGKWWPPARFAAMSGLMMGCGYLGQILATMPLAVAAEWIGWRWAFSAVVVALAVSGVAIFLFVRDTPGAPVRHRPPPPTGGVSIIGGMREVLRSPVFPGLFAAAFIGYSTTFAVRGLWAGPYMLDIHAMDAIARGNLLLLFTLIATVGISASGWLASRLKSPRIVVIGFAAVSGLSMSIMAAVPGISAANFVIVICAFSLVSNFFPAVLAHAQASFPERLRGRSLTMVNFATFAGVGITQVLSGLIIDHFAVDGSGAHPEIAYRWMYGYLAAVVAVGLALYFFIAKFRPIAQTTAGKKAMAAEQEETTR